MVGNGQNRDGQYCDGQDPDGRVPEERSAQPERPALGLAYGSSQTSWKPDTTVSLPCLVMLQRVSRSYKGHQISEKFDTNEEVKLNLF